MPNKNSKSRQKSNYFSESFDLPNPGLRTYFSIVEKGQPDEYRTTFYKGKSLDEIMQGWMPKLRTIRRKWPTLYEYEIDLGEKVGPMSVMLPLKQRLPDIDSYYDSISLSQVPVDPRAISALKDEWKQVAGLRIRSSSSTLEQMKKSTNSGSPYFEKRRNVISKTIPAELEIRGQSVLQHLPSRTYKAAAVLGWRGQEGGPNIDDVKQRVVWMFPFAVNHRELQVYQPLIEACQLNDLVPAWVSMDAVDRRITKLFDSKGKNDLIICTDFSKFDQHFNHTCQDVSRSVLEWLFSNDPDIADWINNVFPIKYMIPLAYDWDKVRFGEHGMGSGSGGTNADETILHRALQHEAAILHGKVLNPNSQCLGDDGILSYPGCSAEDVVSTYCSHGLEMNPDKQYVSKQDCTYLRRWHHNDYRINGVCVGVYSTLRALGRLAEQERFYDPNVWGPKMVALRQLSIIENVKWHPLREEFADYCMKGDKYGLGLGIPGFLSNIEREAQKAIDYMPDFLGYTKTMQTDVQNSKSVGIADWWIVNYLKSK